MKEEKLKEVDKAEEILNGIIEQSQAFSIKDLAINGNDLIALGIEKGKNIGLLLNNLLQLVIDEKIENTKESLLEYVKSSIKEGE